MDKQGTVFSSQLSDEFDSTFSKKFCSLPKFATIIMGKQMKILLSYIFIYNFFIAFLLRKLNIYQVSRSFWIPYYFCVMYNIYKSEQNSYIFSYIKIYCHDMFLSLQYYTTTNATRGKHGHQLIFILEILII